MMKKSKGLRKINKKLFSLEFEKNKISTEFYDFFDTKASEVKLIEFNEIIL